MRQIVGERTAGLTPLPGQFPGALRASEEPAQPVVVPNRTRPERTVEDIQDPSEQLRRDKGSVHAMELLACPAQHDLAGVEGVAQHPRQPAHPHRADDDPGQPALHRTPQTVSSGWAPVA